MKHNKPTYKQYTSKIPIFNMAKVIKRSYLSNLPRSSASFCSLSASESERTFINV